MKRNIDPFWWGIFGAGGAISAMVLPVLLFINGLAIPLGWVEAPDYRALLSLLENPISRLFLFSVISLSLFHWAHRFRFTLYDGLQVKHLNELVAVICYGSAAIISLIAAFILWNF